MKLTDVKQYETSVVLLRKAVLGPCTGACKGCERAERGTVEKCTPAGAGRRVKAENTARNDNTR